MTLSILIWVPLALSLVAALFPARLAGRAAVVWSAIAVGLAISFLARFKSGAGLQFVTDKVWISSLGIHYKLGLDGLNVALVMTTTIIFCAALLWASMHEWDRPKVFYFQFGLAESAVLGAFCAQDLALFVAFFDLMLIPFYFLSGIWGGPDRVRATTRLVIYTLIGSFFMLVAATATGVLASSQHGAPLTFVLSSLRGLPLSHTSQTWLFLAFAVAFLVKMPLVPFHGWLPDGYKAMPIPAVAVFSAILSKVAAYGFLRIVLPLFPYAAVHFQTLMLIIALVSIVWATLVAITSPDARLVVAYSSVAQLGFIMLGIFSLRPEGAQGALLQMVNHALVTAPLFFIVAALAVRAGGSEKLADMGGIAFRAPVLATLFLIVTFVWLAMPGSSNFVGEFMILLGVFNAKLPIAIVASLGVVGAAAYALRAFILTMHNRVGPRVTSFDISFGDALPVVGLLAIILVLAFYPQFGLRRSAPTVRATVAPAQAQQIAQASVNARKVAQAPMSIAILAAAHLKGPHIDWASFMPFLILGVGALAVLLIGLFGPVARTTVVPLVTLATLIATIVILVTRLHHPTSIISGALAIDGLALVLDMIFAVSAIAAVVLSIRDPAPRSAGQGEYNSLVLFSVLGMAILVSAQNLVTLFVGFELLSIPLYVLCAAEFRREGSLESGLKYLVIGSVGSATLVYGLALVYGATGSTQFAGIDNAILNGGIGNGLLGDPLLLTGLGLVIVGFAFKASVAPFHQWTPDVYDGAPTPVTAFMATATKAAALGVLLRFFDVAAIHVQDVWAPALATLAAITIIVGNVGALGQSSLKRMLGYSSVAQAGYMLTGVVVATQLGVDATVLYLGLYMFMNLAAFAVIVAVQRERADGDELSGLAGLGRRNPWLAWPMSIAMLALAGIPGTVGFIGKFQLIHALVDGSYTWLAIVLVIGSMISLAYYLRVIATLWMRDEVPAPAPGIRGALAGRGGLAPIAGGSPEADVGGGAFVTAPRSSSVAAAGAAPEVVAVAVLFGAACVVFGIFPSVLFDLAAHAGRALGLT